jgi:hypothetical protein
MWLWLLLEWSAREEISFRLLFCRLRLLLLRFPLFVVILHNYVVVHRIHTHGVKTVFKDFHVARLLDFSCEIIKYLVTFVFADFWVLLYHLLYEAVPLRRSHEESGPFDRRAKTPFEKPF